MSQPHVIGPTTLSNSFLSETIQVGVVTRDHGRTREGRVRAGTVPRAYFGTEEATTTIFEIFDIPQGFTMPDPESWYPAPPPG